MSSKLDVFYVVYRPELGLLRQSLQALAEQAAEQDGFESVAVHLWDNAPEWPEAQLLQSLVDEFSGAFDVVRRHVSPANLGFGAGNNRLLQQTDAEWLLLLNQDAVLEPNALALLYREAQQASPELAAVELRQIPYEHPKDYHPVSLQTPWVSGAACLFRRAAMIDVGGFDDSFFMYAEDVDLSWRLRLSGWVLRYQPRAAVWHDTYSQAGEVKPLQAVEGTFNNLLMRLRYGTPGDVLLGLVGVFREVLARPTFAGRRWRFLMLYPRLLGRLPAILRQRRSDCWQSAGVAEFRGWNFARHREGAFHAFWRASEWAGKPQPLVSIVVRTHRRPAMLREALTTLANQTWKNLEVVVVEDGEPLAREMVENEFSGRMRVRYLSTGVPVGRSAAGNLGLGNASGDWLGFLDDDDQLYADHLEVMLQSAQQSSCKGVYGLGWEVLTEIRSLEPLDYHETGCLLRYRQPFSRLLMWHHNYLPIQCVLFHRDLYQRWGGFAEDMDQLEDWDLWVRYSLEDDFLMVDKTTSRYRVPADPQVTTERLAKLDQAYQDARARQDALEIRMTPRQFVDAAEAYSHGMSADIARHQRLKQLLARMGLLPLVRTMRTRWLQWTGR